MMKLGELDILDDKRAAQAVSDCGWSLHGSLLLA
jgi:hypothetical protein